MTFKVLFWFFKGMNSYLINILEDLKENRNSDFVFSRNSKGEMYKGDFRGSIKSTLVRAGIKKKLRFHDLRHTFAANYMMSGGSITTLNKILGHSTLQMTMRYIHFSQDFIESEIDKLDFD